MNDDGSEHKQHVQNRDKQLLDYNENKENMNDIQIASEQAPRQDTNKISHEMKMNVIDVGNDMTLLMSDNFMYNQSVLNDEQLRKQKLKDEITVIVKNEMNKATLLFRMKKGESMKDLKLKIKERLNINPCDQKLTFDDDDVNDDGIEFGSGRFKDGDTIKLNIKVSALSVNVQVLGSEMIRDMRFWNNLSVKI